MTSRRLLLLTAFALTASIAASWLGAPFRAAAQDRAISINKVADAEWRPEAGQPLFIAVLGSDIRNGPPGGPGGRCDAVHIVAINPRKRAGTIINIPRDSWVNVPGAGPQRINTGCFYGGSELMVQTMRQATGIPIQYYVNTEFSHFRGFISDLGGVRVNVPYAMNDAASGARFRAGPVTMNGAQALAFNRNRKDTPRGDFSRTDNQGRFIAASLLKFQDDVGKDPRKLAEYLRAARRHVQISVPLPDLIRLSFTALRVDPAKVQNITVPGSTGSVGAASVVFMAPGDIFRRVADDAIY